MDDIKASHKEQGDSQETNLPGRSRPPDPLTGEEK